MRESPDQANLSPETIALAALGWILADTPRSERLLDLTGLTPDGLRTSLDDKRILSAILEFLINHEPDLVAAAQELQLSPEDIVSAHRLLDS